MLKNSGVRRSFVLGSAVALTVGLAACGSENGAGANASTSVTPSASAAVSTSSEAAAETESTSGSGTSASASPGTGATTTGAIKTGTIKIRTIAAEGSAVTNYPDVNVGAEAAVDAINASGGADGRQIEYSFCNTNGDANQAQTCARDAVSDGVAAVVGQVDIYSTQSMPILEAAGVPLIGNVPAGGAIDYENAASYPLHAGNYGAFSGAPYAFKAAGKQQMVIVAADLAATKAQTDIVTQAADAAGMPVTGIVKIPPQGVTDYSPYAQQITDSGADAVLIMLGPAALQAMYKSMESLGVEIQAAGTIFSFGESEAQAVGSASDGIWVLSPIPSPRDSSSPAVKQYNDDLDSSGVPADDPSLHRSAGLNAWLAVHAAAEVSKTIDGEVTAASMTEALKKATDIDVAGVLSWSPSELGSADLGKFPRLPKSDYEVLTFQDGQLIPTDLPSVTEPLAGVR